MDLARFGGLDPPDDVRVSRVPWGPGPMRCFPWVRAALAAVTLVAGARANGQSWSPDGRWLAFSVAVRDPNPRFDWLFGQGGDRSAFSPAATRHRIWATRPGSDESVMLAESDGPLTQPSWNRDGSMLAYGRVVREGGRPVRFEVVVQDAPERRRIVGRWPIGPKVADLDDLEASEVTWSANGRFLAAPQVSSPGVVVLAAEDGRPVKTIPGASRVSWAPNGERLAFLTGGEQPGLYVADVDSGEPRRLADVPGSDHLPAPVWDADGRSILLVAYHPEVTVPSRESRAEARRAGVSRPFDSSQLHLERISADGTGRETVLELVHYPFSGLDELVRVSLAFDRSREELFYATATADDPSVIKRCRVRTREILETFNPLHEGIATGPLALSPSPTRRVLAIRFGPRGRLSPPATCDIEPGGGRLLIPIVTDASARATWLATLLDAMRSAIEGAHSPGTEADRRSTRPTILPAPGDLDAEDPAMIRIRRLARQGLALCERPEGTPTSDGEFGSLLEQSRFLVHYFLPDFESALTSLEQPGPAPRTPDERLRLLGVRAQIFMGMGRFDRAGSILEYLRNAAVESGRQIEETPTGVLLHPADESGGWADLLAIRLEDLKVGKPRPADDLDVPEFTNPDAPQPGLGLDPIPQVQFLIPPVGDVFQPALPFRPEPNLPPEPLK